MTKELPFFKFYPSSWMEGNIVLEDYRVQGVYIHVVAYYWSRGCELDESTLFKKFKARLSSIETLLKGGFIKIEGGLVKISFLDEQKADLLATKEKLSKSGKEGAEKKKLLKTQGRLKGGLSIKEVDIEVEEEREVDKDKQNHKNDFVVATAPKKNILDRKIDFANSLTGFVSEFSKETVRAFFNHWSESNPNGKKMRWEMERTFEIKNRLDTWRTNEKKFNTRGAAAKTSNLDILKEGGDIAEDVLRKKYADEENDLKA